MVMVKKKNVSSRRRCRTDGLSNDTVSKQKTPLMNLERGFFLRTGLRRQ